MEIKHVDSGVTAEDIRKFCLSVSSDIEETIREVKGLDGLGDTSVVLDRLGDILTEAERMSKLGEASAAELEKRESVAAAYRKIEL